METRTDEIADRIDRFSTLVPISDDSSMSFNQFVVEADECGSMKQWLAVCPDAQVVHGMVGCMVSIEDREEALS